MVRRPPTRACRRTGCKTPAAATLSFRYDTRQVWLLDLPEEPLPSLYDLCAHHADDLVVPRGWERVDQRTDAPRPAAADPDADPDPDPDPDPDGGPAPGRRRVNRYAELVRDLPRVAAALAADARAAAGASPASEVLGTGGPRRPPGGASPATRVRAGASPASAVPGGSRPAGGATRVRPGDRPLRAADRPVVPEVPGQLALHVSDDERAVGEAVVVSISSASGRRRATALR